MKIEKTTWDEQEERLDDEAREKRGNEFLAELKELKAKVEKMRRLNENYLCCSFNLSDHSSPCWVGRVYKLECRQF